jgi:5-methylcytosine-specific restriction enzyme subunit McrC
MTVLEATPTDDGRRIYKVESRNSIELDLSDVIFDGKLSIFKEVEELGLLFLRFQKSKVIISAGGYIGHIPLTPNIIIEVRPKLPVRNLARILDVARSSLRSLQSTDRHYKVENGASGSILEFLTSNFVDAIRLLELHGVAEAVFALAA